MTIRLQWAALVIAAMVLVGSWTGPTMADPSVHKVLVLHAYHDGLDWSDAVSRGIHSVFDPFSRRIELYAEYLDSWRFKGEDHQKMQEALVRIKLDQQRFDVVMVVGDEALQLISEKDVLPHPAPAVVFCGVSQFTPAQLPADRRLTGVVETLDHRATLDLMLKLHPECRRVVVLFDEIATGRKFQHQLDALITEFQGRVTIATWQDAALEELPARLASLGPDDLIYLLALNRDKRLPYVYSDEGVRLVARWSPVAVYSPLEIYLGKGTVGGKITSGVNQGERAAEMALRILSGEAVEAIPVLLQSPNHYAFDDHQLQRWHLKVKDLPTDSIVVHQPQPLWERHFRKIFFLAFGLALTVVALVFVLLRQIKKQRHWLRFKAELDDRMREKTAQLQLVHQQLKKQSLMDDVTGIANRRHLMERFAVEIKKAQRFDTPFTIIMLDIDRLKTVNDGFGYLVGDQVLHDVGQTLKRSVRDIDLAGRYSSQLFMVVLPNTDRDKGFATAERIRAAISALQWEQGQVRVTISGGVASLADHPAAELTKVAKNRLTRVKFQGGDRIAPPYDPPP